ncbi:MAG: nicotinamide-nucleotide amidohydrolase family protein [Lachnospiraceae bacterium]|nr:nicotinamide-nucleotide amidohydrolase family protein [Lachnospiraceae bacterium]
MIVEYISIGTEILLGNIENQNAAFLAEQFAKLGFTSYYQTSVGDNKARINECLDIAVQRSDIVVITGGMGPSAEDITKESVAFFLGREVVDDKISGCIEIPNDFGHSSGEIIENDNHIFVLLPGSFNEMKPMFLTYAVPYLQKKSDSKILTKTVKMAGISESEVEEKIKDLILSHSNPSITIYPKAGEVHIHVTAKGADEEECERLNKPVIKELKTLIGEYIYTTDDEVSLEQAVVDLLISNKLTVSCAESCTGGMVSARLINVAGVSEVLKTCLVTYSDKSKHKNLGVKKSSIAKYTAVSAQVCREMAEANAISDKADVYVSVTGVAGPDSPYEGKEVGLVYIGCSVKGKTEVKEYHFKGDRAKVRECATTAALDLLRVCILKYVYETQFGVKE